jgi:hypothetical protein
MQLHACALPPLVPPAEDLETCLRAAAAHARRVVTDSLAYGEWLLKAKVACPHGQ